MTRPTTAATPHQLLAEALRRDPARPLVTYYDDATGERTELSVATFANWVAKTANLLRDDLDVQPASTVSLDLPVHWQGAVWLHACWALGLHVVPDGGELQVVAYDDAYDMVDDGTVDPASHRDRSGAAEVVALGLGPMGLPRRDAAAPAGTTLDYDREVHGHGDRFVPAPAPGPDSPALTVGSRTLSGAGLVAPVEAACAALAPGARLLVTAPLITLDAVLAATLVPLAGPVAAVLCRHPDPAGLAARVVQEHLVAVVGPGAPALPFWSSGGPTDNL